MDSCSLGKTLKILNVSAYSFIHFKLFGLLLLLLLVCFVVDSEKFLVLCVLFCSVPHLYICTKS